MWVKISAAAGIHERAVQIDSCAGASPRVLEGKRGRNDNHRWLESVECVGRWRLGEMIYPSGIPADDLGLLLLRTIHQDLLNDLPTPGEGRLKMRII